VVVIPRYQLKDAILEGGIPFDRAYGKNLFEYCDMNSSFNNLFIETMTNRATVIMKKIVESYKGFERINRLVDVGGGNGVSLSIITSKYPHIKGINFDLPHVIRHASPYPGKIPTLIKDKMFGNAKEKTNTPEKDRCNNNIFINS